METVELKVESHRNTPLGSISHSPKVSLSCNHSGISYAYLISFFVLNTNGFIPYKLFSNFPFLLPFTFLKQKHLWKPQIHAFEYSKRKEASEVGTWTDGEPAVLHQFVRTEQFQVPCTEKS